MIQISKMIEQVFNLIDGLDSLKRNTERKIKYEIRRAKRNLVLYLIQTTLMGIGVLLILAGVIIFITRFFPVEFVLLGVGLVITYLAFIIKIMKR